MKKMNLFMLLLIVAMVMPATVWAGKTKTIKYGNGLILEGLFPGEATLTCGNSLTFTGYFEAKGTLWLKGEYISSDNYINLKSKLVGKYGIPSNYLNPSKVKRNNLNSDIYGNMFQADVKDCRLTATTDKGHTLTYNGDALWGQFGDLFTLFYVKER